MLEARSAGESARRVDIHPQVFSQIQTYLNAGFNDILGVNPDVYISSFPGLGEQPAEYVGRFDIPVVVDPRISLEDYCRAGDIKPGYQPLDLGRIARQKVPATPEIPYIFWSHDGMRYQNSRTESAMREIGKKDGDEVGATFLELAAFSLQGLLDIKKGQIAAAGSYYFQTDSLPALLPSPVGGVEIGRWTTNYDNFSGRFIRLLTRGREVVAAAETQIQSN